MQKARKDKKGFTLVEVIVVLVILAILAAILVPTMIGWINKSNEKKDTVIVNTMAKAATTAFTEIYAKYGSDLGGKQIMLNSSQPSKESWDQDFEKSFKELIGTDVDLTHTYSIFITADNKGTIEAFTIYYNLEKNKGILYNRDNQGKVTIESTKY